MWENRLKTIAVFYKCMSLALLIYMGLKQPLFNVNISSPSIELNRLYHIGYIRFY